MKDWYKCGKCKKVTYRDNSEKCPCSPNRAIYLQKLYRTIKEEKR
tara:strand:+ start:178 stop:312 length:135 start_codon:yes stop_codon:yes gene_type:complete